MNNLSLVAFLLAQLVKICLQYRRLGFSPWVGKIPWQRAWQPTSVFLPGESHGQRSLVGYSPWGCNESDMTEQLSRKHSELGGSSGRQDSKAPGTWSLLEMRQRQPSGLSNWVEFREKGIMCVITSLTQTIQQHMQTVNKKGLFIKKKIVVLFKPWHRGHSDIAP